MKSLITRLSVATLTAFIGLSLTTTQVYAGLPDCMYNMAWDLVNLANGEMVGQSMIEVTVTPGNIWTIVDVFQLPVNLAHNPMALAEHMRDVFNADLIVTDSRISFKVDMKKFGTKGCNDHNGPGGFPPYEGPGFTMVQFPKVHNPSFNYQLMIISLFITVCILALAIPVALAFKKK